MPHPCSPASKWTHNRTYITSAWGLAVMQALDRQGKIFPCLHVLWDARHAFLLYSSMYSFSLGLPCQTSTEFPICRMRACLLAPGSHFGKRVTPSFHISAHFVGLHSLKNPSGGKLFLAGTTLMPGYIFHHSSLGGWNDVIFHARLCELIPSLRTSALERHSQGISRISTEDVDHACRRYFLH
jgi:hypothetical protein